MNVWGITDRGKIREQNQDAFAHQVLPDGRVIALVCDGMGGARAGNIASSMAVDVFMEAFLEDGEDSPDLEHMERAAARANRQVFRRAVEDENCVGMGTTLVAALAGELEDLTEIGEHTSAPPSATSRRSPSGRAASSGTALTQRWTGCGTSSRAGRTSSRRWRPGRRRKPASVP